MKENGRRSDLNMNIMNKIRNSISLWKVCTVYVDLVNRRVGYVGTSLLWYGLMDQRLD